MNKRDLQRLQYALEDGGYDEKNQPLAWAVFDADGRNAVFFWNEETAVRYAFHTGSVARPLHRYPGSDT